MSQTTKKIMELDKVETKQKSGGGELIVLSVRKRLFGKNESLAVDETRQWVFIKDGEASAAQSSSAKPKSKAERHAMEGALQHSIRLTPASFISVFRSNFQFPRYTFIKRTLHKRSPSESSGSWSPDPILAIRETVRGSVAKRWKSMSYRAVGPAYVGETLTLNVGAENDGNVAAWAENDDHMQVMNVVIEPWQ